MAPTTRVKLGLHHFTIGCVGFTQWLDTTTLFNDPVGCKELAELPQSTSSVMSSAPFVYTWELDCKDLAAVRYGRQT